jgi:hypothetical protein
VDQSTISSVTLGRSHSGERDVTAPRPQLFKLIDCDHPLWPPSRHLLDEVDEVGFGRGSAGFVRDREGRRLQLRVPDGRMSVDHARLVRVHGRWLLEDFGSKNGCVVNGNLTRRSLIADGDLFELGHTFFLFREAPVVADAAPDVAADQLPAPLPQLATFVAGLEATWRCRGGPGPGSRCCWARPAPAGGGRAGATPPVRRPGPLVPVTAAPPPETLLEASCSATARARSPARS